MAQKSWTFLNPITRTRLEDTLDQTLRERCVELIQLAATSNPTPHQSKYFVPTAAMSKSGKMARGGNHEKSKTCHSHTYSHGETAAIINLHELTDLTKDPLQVIAFSELGEEGGIPNHCGDCRDAIAEYMSRDYITISGNPKGGIISVVPGHNYFFEDFDPLIHFSRLTKAFQQALIAQRAGNTAYCTDDSRFTEDRLYGAAITTWEGEIFRGSFHGDATYHPTFPIQAAICNLRDSSNNPNRLNIQSITIVGNTKPNVPYKERQFATELKDLQDAYYRKEFTPIPVHLYRQESGVPAEAWQTDTYEWIPQRFSAAAFGFSGQLKQGADRLIQATQEIPGAKKQ